MTIIELNKKLWPFPESWNELSTAQAIKCMAVLLHGYNVDQAYLQFIRILSGCGWYNFFSTKKAHLQQYLYLCDFLLNPTSLTAQLLPRYNGLVGPAKDFDNLRMNEYAYAQSFFEDYRDNENKEALHKLVATLYRPAGGDDAEDVREPFSEFKMLMRVRQVSQWPPHVLELVYLWYGGCYSKLMEYAKNIPTSGDAQPALHGIVSIMRNVAREGTYGDFEKVERLYVKMFFMELMESGTEAKNQK